MMGYKRTYKHELMENMKNMGFGEFLGKLTPAEGFLGRKEEDVKKRKEI